MELSSGLVGQKVLVSEKFVGVGEVLGVHLVVGQGDDGLRLSHLLLKGLVTLVVGVERPQEGVLLLHRVGGHLLVPLPHQLLLGGLHVHARVPLGLSKNGLLDRLLVHVTLRDCLGLRLLHSFPLHGRHLVKSRLPLI